jgi:predicted ATPase/DNA-binding SARP family transcriptional activator/tetratricopeptide (TPR) repeat protein
MGSTAHPRQDRSEASREISFRVLGPVEAVDAAGLVLPLGPPRNRSLLAALVVHAGSVLSVDRLTELLWDGCAPRTARTIVHGAVAGLRGALEPCRGRASSLLKTRDGGYLLDVPPERVDILRFEQLLAQGRRLVGAAPARASQLLGEALSSWRGPALAGIECTFAREAAFRWEELRLECTESRMEVEIALGHHHDVVADLEDLVARHPLREPLCALLVLALYRCGRQADALHALRSERRTLVEELGLEPGPQLQRLEQAVLRQSPELDAGPPAAGPGRPLPSPIDSFVGRVRERAGVAALVSTDRLVTLTGPGGSGKTRLAVEVGRDLHDSGVHVCVVDLAPLTTPELVGETVAEALGVRGGPGQDLVETVAAALSGQDTVLLLDNCEHLAGACAAFVRPLLAAAPGLRVLATSREAMHVPGERVVAVRPLATATAEDGFEDIAACDAVQLFAQRAAAARPGFAVTPANAHHVLEVCRRLDGLPLALELAAARAASMPVQDLAERLDDRFRLLDAAVRSTDARHQGLAATLAWSSDLLDAPARSLFARVSVFPATFSLSAAEAVVSGGELPQEDIGLVLARLVASSTVQLEEEPDGTVRYRMLETTRHYARDRLDAPAMASLRERHARHHLALAQEAELHLFGPDSPPWLVRLQAGRDDFRAALEWAFGPGGDQGLGVRLVGCLWHPWDVRGARGEGLHWVHTALRAVRPDPGADRLPLLSAGALLHLGRAEFPEVAALAGEQLVLARATGASAWEGDALALTATVAWARGEFDRAQHLYEDAVLASLSGGDRWRAALAEAQLARLHRDRDEPDAARSVVLSALRDAEEVGEHLARGLAVDVLASLEHRWGDVVAAARLVDEALGHYGAVGYREGEASALQLAGQIALSSGELGRAREAFEQALALCRRIGHRSGSATALEGMATVAADAGEDDLGLLLLGAAAALRTEIGVPPTGSALTHRLRVQDRLTGRLGPVGAARALRRGAGLSLPALLEEAWKRHVRA